MTLDKLILDDFLTYEHLEYNFIKKPLLIQGINLTDDYQKSNGTGKSGMQTGIEFCITASNSRDVRDNELITFGKKQARAQLIASCKNRKQSIHIDWTINLKGSNKLILKIKQFDKDVWSSVIFSTVNDGKKYILDWFAISKEDLFNYFIINKTRFKSFFKSSNKEKVDLINRFSDASIVKGIEDIDTSKLEDDERGKEIEIQNLEGKLELLRDQIYNEKNRDLKKELLDKAKELDDEILEIREEIESIKKEIGNNSLAIGDYKLDIKDFEKERELISADLKNEEIIHINVDNALKNISKKINSSEKLVKDFVSTNWNTKKGKFTNNIEKDRDKIVLLEERASKINTQETLILKLIQKIDIELDGVITCPNCSHEFLLGTEDIDTLKSRKREANSLRKAFVKKIDNQRSCISVLKNVIGDNEKHISLINKQESDENNKKNNLIEKLNEVKEKYNEEQKELNTSESRLSELKSEISNYDLDIKDKDSSIKNIHSKIDTLGKEIKKYESDIVDIKSKKKSLKEDKNKSYINTLKKDLSALELIKITKNKELITIGDSIYNLNQWKVNFKQFRMFLANQSLKVIEYHNNRYLKEMGSDLRVIAEGFKVLANNTIKEEITIKVIRDTERSFSSFSGGERGRLLFASILANRHMINETHPYGGLDFLSIDEVFEGIDSVGLRHLIEAAKTLSISVMIITHVTDEDLDDNTLTIVKENGISKIKE